MIKLKQNITNKISVLTAGITTLTSSVLAHSGEDSEPASGMMMDGSWMHTGADMMGYNMWGMGWFGLLFGLAFWILVILGIVYLYQQITENRGDQE
jgi:hypothetical protein